ncbi:MAG: acetyl-CoA carboxylase biotin carboxyl carrier protein [Bacteroidia bacterium]|nr:acetyl-CoA carboxylase biotin carboxyl carrier protein [Bacteroidia bacterium]MDW8134786.1 acetyl-CoA carboxylase biotin carboxyl carrier protein [Bacteroidia bacterium]
MDIKSILELLRFVSKSDLSEVIIEDGNFRLTVRRGVSMTSGNVIVSAPSSPAMMVSPTVPTIPSPPSPSEAPSKTETPPPSAPKKTEYIRSPMVGTFYRRPSPDKEPFVQVGDIIQKGQVVCIIEAMKLFNEIQSEISGKIVRILVEDAQAVEYDQPLFEVEPIE